MYLFRFTLQDKNDPSLGITAKENFEKEQIKYIVAPGFAYAYSMWLYTTMSSSSVEAPKVKTECLGKFFTTETHNEIPEGKKYFIVGDCDGWKMSYNKKVNGIKKVEMTVADIEKKLSMSPGSLRIKKEGK